MDQLLGVMGAEPRVRAFPTQHSADTRGETLARAPLDLAEVAERAWQPEPAPSAAAQDEAPANLPPDAASLDGAAAETDARTDEVYGPYRLLERVAVGGMAEVFKAKRSGVEGFEKIVAVKRILAHLSDNKEFVEMFIDEAKMVACLTHPNIVQISDLGRLEGAYYIAMDYVHGRDLRSILRRSRDRGLRLPLDLSIFVVGRVCSALEYAHRKKDERGRPLQIVHRDISPQNILISFEGDVKLADFGIAKAASKAHTTDRGALRGKLLYMSPEQASGKPVDLRSDIFSLGIVFYEMVTEQKPFMGTSEMSILETVRECRVAPPTSLNPRIPSSLEKVVMKALERDPDQRYQDGAEMQRDLDRILRERQAPTANELARFMELLFEPYERGRPPADEPPWSEPARDVPAPGLEIEFDGQHGEGASEQRPAQDQGSLQRLLKRFGIK
jgi:serine/threonine protein kinase